MLRRAMLLLVLALLLVIPMQAQDIVHAILFYSPTCPHCHKVIQEDLPVFEAEFGDQLRVNPVNVTVEYGAGLYHGACDAFDSTNQCGGVPMMLIGDQLLFGATQIPDLAPGIIREGLANGGIAIPDIPGMAAYYEQWLVVNELDAPAPQESDYAAETVIVDVVEPQTWQDRLAADPEANAVAVLVLVGLLLSLVVSGWYAMGRSRARLQSIDRPVSIGVAVATLFVAGTIVSQSDGVTPLAWLLLGLTVVIAGMLLLNKRTWIFPLVAVAGLVVAGYLAYIEVTESEAVCGVIGDCNTVQQSEYATLFGVLPIGVFGIIGYLAILMVWGMNRAQKLDPAMKARLSSLMFGMIWAGVAFSVYLTFLEPFVIGATCAWCLMSALLMMLLLWLVISDDTLVAER